MKTLVFILSLLCMVVFNFAVGYRIGYDRGIDVATKRVMDYFKEVCGTIFGMFLSLAIAVWATLAGY